MTYVVDQRFRLDDRAGIVAMGLVPALLGLTVMGLWADGVVGSGWNVTGVGDYLGVAGGVSGTPWPPASRPTSPANSRPN